MLLAVLLINLHAAIPHTHEETNGCSADLFSTEDNESSSPFDDLWHFDLGEDHLEVLKVSPKLKIQFPSEVVAFSKEVSILSVLNWVFPLEESAIPPPLIGSKSLRAPPFFA